MRDTGFNVFPARLDRLASCYDTNPETRALHDGADDRQWGRPSAFPAGRDGLVSTIDDYLAFGQMLLNKGKYASERILSRPAVETMTTNHLTPEQAAAASPFLGDNRGWRRIALVPALATQPLHFRA